MESSSKLKLSLVQSNIHWEGIDLNLSMFEKKINSISTCDIIVLPEMFTTGFTNNSKELAEEMGQKTCQWMLKMAKQKSSAVCGSAIIKEGSKIFNRFLWVEPNGKIKYYDKKHLFAMAGEDENYTAGEKKKIINYKDWKINLQVCYDLRFPVWSRRIPNGEEDYDLLIYVASWPVTRVNAWSTLLKSRAIENQSYCIGVNRIGTDGSGIDYSGESVVIDSLGNVQAGSHPGKEEIINASIDKKHLMKIREKLPFYKDQDSFTLT